MMPEILAFLHEQMLSLSSGISYDFKVGFLEREILRKIRYEQIKHQMIVEESMMMVKK
jgi:hypothetical protein